MVNCPRCTNETGKTGRIERFQHVKNGKCFLCNGFGKVTEEEYNNYKKKHSPSAYISEEELDEEFEKMQQIMDDFKNKPKSKF